MTAATAALSPEPHITGSGPAATADDAMVKRYARLRRDIAGRLNTFLWAANETDDL